MSLSPNVRAKILNIISSLRLIAGLVLFIAISWEIIYGDHIHLSQTYLNLQLAVCSIFLLDFFVRWGASQQKSHFLVHNFLFFLISIPYLNIIHASDIVLPRELVMAFGLMPLIRAFTAFYIVVKWFVTNKVRELFYAYILTVFVFTYVSALIFYDFEVLVNHSLHGFGDAFWWAWMNVTTVGASIFPVTTIGKIICVLLPILGMMMFPIFTTYIMQRYAPHKKGSDA